MKHTKKLTAAVLIVLGALTLTGCGDKTYLSESEKFRICVENGGSWQSGAWGEESCIMPDTPVDNQPEGAES